MSVVNIAPGEEWILGLEELILATTEELQKGNHVVEVDSYINSKPEKDENKNNPDFHRPYDTKSIEDIRLYFMIEAALAAT